MKKVLYTCDSGIGLFKSGNLFGAWENTAPSYEKRDTMILVEEEHILKTSRREYRVINIESVEIVEQL